MSLLVEVKAAQAKAQQTELVAYDIGVGVEDIRLPPLPTTWLPEFLHPLLRCPLGSFPVMQ